MASSKALPTVLVLALDPLTQNMSLDFLINKADVTFVTTEAEACDYLQSQRFTAILVVDPTITDESPNLRRQVTTFAKTGGRVILCHYFASLVRFPDFDDYMQIEWDLPWRYGCYSREDFHLNRQGVNLCRKPGLPARYSMKAVRLKSVEPSSKIYYPPDTACIQPHVLSGDKYRPISESTEAGIAFTRIGDGWLGYIGDVNDEEATLTVVLAMIRKA